MLSLEQAQAQILEAVRPLPTETADLAGSLGRFAAEPARSTVDLPPFDNSAMDGYAVRADDLAKAAAGSPVALRVIGTAAAGAILGKTVEHGTCARVFTGSMLPSGADAVVMQEDVQPNGADASSVLFTESAPPWDNVRFRGGDVKTGAVLLEVGDRLTAPRLSLLAATGITTMRVTRRPVAGLLATGTELREPGQPLEPGAIYESNRMGLAAMARQSGAAPTVYPLVRDDFAATQAALEKAFSECDVVITTGGVSVGETDWIKPAFAAIGGALDFWTVSIKPGKPFAFGRWKDKFLFGLPGNPVSAMVTFLLLARPALLRLQGASAVLPRTFPATLSEPLSNPAPRRHFMRVTLDAKGRARSAGAQASHILSALAQSDGLADVPPNTTLPAGSIVPIMAWD